MREGLVHFGYAWDCLHIDLTNFKGVERSTT